MNSRIPTRKLVLNSLLTAITSTGLIGFLLIVNAGTIPNLFRVLLDVILSMFISGMIHILILKYVGQHYSRWPRYQRVLLISISTFILTLVYNVLLELILAALINPAKLTHLNSSKGMSEQLIGAALISIVILVSHNQVLLRQRRLETELELSEIRAANVEATNLLLQQQIQPHFLFNALNILNSLYKRDYQTGHKYMLHLAGFLRSSISSTRQKLLTVADEIKICNDYIAMQKIRFNDALQFSIKVDDSAQLDGCIPSFSLQPLLENAIKHNELTSENPLHIELYADNGYLFVTNNLLEKQTPAASTGQGLSNLIKRYRLLSGDEVVVEKSGQNFSVRLKILPNEHCNN
ncbi:MAG: hypothetical protein EOO88_23465 [Pedobacter sp.]|nr:MAG: hypothetical protein EOO88_23465 [Pedobacter sp.]